MQTIVFNQAQREILNMMSCLHSEEDIADLKEVLVRFLNARMQRELDKLWENGTLTEEKMEMYKNEHLRTKYRA